MQLWLALLPKQVYKSFQLAVRQQFNLDALLVACAQLVWISWIRVAALCDEKLFLKVIKKTPSELGCIGSTLLSKSDIHKMSDSQNLWTYISINAWENKTGLQLVIIFIFG